MRRTWPRTPAAGSDSFRQYAADRMASLKREQRVPERTEALGRLDLASEQAGPVKPQPTPERARPLHATLDSSRAADASQYHAGLTERELEVLRLLTSGQSSRLIAGELVLSVRTVERHVSNIYTKLGVQTRAQATACALRHGLVPAD